MQLVSENNLGLSPSPAAYGSEGAVSSVSCTSSLSVGARFGWRCSTAGVLCWLHCRALTSRLLEGAVLMPLELLRRRLRTLDIADRWGIESPWRPFTCKSNQPCLTSQAAQVSASAARSETQCLNTCYGTAKVGQCSHGFSSMHVSDFWHDKWTIPCTGG